MARRKKKSGDQQLDLIKAYQSFFETEDGKLILYDLMRAGRMFTKTVGSSPEETSRNEGQRELVVYILEQINRDIEQVIKFIEQQKENERAYNL